MSSDVGARGGAGIGTPLMAAASPMISPNGSAVRRGSSLGATVAVEALEWEDPERKDVVQGGDVVHLDEVVVALDVQNPRP